MKDPVVQVDGEEYRIIGKGATRDGKTFCHLASTTRGKQQKNGWYPAQICDWLDVEIIEAAEGWEKS